MDLSADQVTSASPGIGPGLNGAANGTSDVLEGGDGAAPGVSPVDIDTSIERIWDARLGIGRGPADGAEGRAGRPDRADVARPAVTSKSGAYLLGRNLKRFVEIDLSASDSDLNAGGGNEVPGGQGEDAGPSGSSSEHVHLRVTLPSAKLATGDVYRISCTFRTTIAGGGGNMGPRYRIRLGSVGQAVGSAVEITRAVVSNGRTGVTTYWFAELELYIGIRDVDDALWAWYGGMVNGYRGVDPDGVATQQTGYIDQSFSNPDASQDLDTDRDLLITSDFDTVIGSPISGDQNILLGCQVERIA